MLRAQPATALLLVLNCAIPRWMVDAKSVQAKNDHATRSENQKALDAYASRAEHLWKAVALLETEPALKQLAMVMTHRFVQKRGSH